MFHFIIDYSFSWQRGCVSAYIWCFRVARISDISVKSMNMLNCAEPQSLLTMWTNRINAIHRDRCREFSGRLEAGLGNKAELYQHMKDDASVSVPLPH